MKTFSIYALKDPRDGEIRYVGKTFNLKRRYNAHCLARGNTHRDKWVRLLKENSLVPLLGIIQSGFTDELEALAAEVRWIAALRGIGRNLTNLTDGGEGSTGHFPSEESKARNRASNLGRAKSLQTRAKMSAAFTGRYFSPETREKMAAAKLGRKQSTEHIQKRVKANLGKRRSESAIAKTVAKHKGRRNSPEVIASMCAAAKAWRLKKAEAEAIAQ